MKRTFAMIIFLTMAAPVTALDDAHWGKADAAIERGITYLRQTQGADGSWSPRAGPAVTAMIVAVMLDRTDLAGNDPYVETALAYILRHAQEDGGIHSGILQNYNTAICLSALAKVNDRPDAADAVAKAQRYLRQLQWHDQPDPHGAAIDESHPFFGGAGYGQHGRPDMSNTHIMLQGLYDSGLSCDDPAFQRAVSFISRCQGTKSNEFYGDKIVSDGGFIYATSIDKDHIGVPESKANAETVDVPGAGPVSLLRTYGSMTYAGFKSYIYANLGRDDPRVIDAYNWIRRHYTVDRNPGLPESRKLQGHYYYLMTMSRALDAWGATHIETPDGTKHDWANDLIDKLVAMQRNDGSWINESSRWMERDANLVTAYALVALTHALK